MAFEIEARLCNGLVGIADGVTDSEV